MSVPVYHGPEHRPWWVGGSDPAIPVGYFELKVTADANALDGLLPPSATVPTVGDGKFVIEIGEDLDGATLVRAGAYVTTAGGALTIQIRKVGGANLLTTPITIDAGELSSYDAAVPPVVDPANVVGTGDQVSVDVDAVAGAPKGLGVRLIFAVV